VLVHRDWNPFLSTHSDAAKSILRASSLIHVVLNRATLPSDRRLQPRRALQLILLSLRLLDREGIFCSVMNVVLEPSAVPRSD
jgi:hypothetical protein